MTTRIRFAPSPTGFSHIGGLRTAYYNYLFARQNNGVFILRIEDTDQARTVPGGIENIIKTLEWAGLDWDEGPQIQDGQIIDKGNKGPYIQSNRLEIYKKYINELLEKGHAYYCFCSEGEVEAMREKQIQAKQPPMYNGNCRDLTKENIDENLKNKKSYVIRLKVPKEGETLVSDIIYGDVKFENKIIDDQVLLKSDGFPTYHLANIVDDHFMEITHVIRGEEWLPSTPKHILLYKAFGWTAPQFAHLPLLLNPDRTKLSKRTGDVAVEEYRKKGYLPEALLNFVALLGGNPRPDKEIYSKEELIKEFSLERLNKAGAIVNFEKLKWLNGIYLKQLSIDDLATHVIPYLIDAGLITEKTPENYFAPRLNSDVSYKYIVSAINLGRQRAQVLNEFPVLLDFVFAEIEYDPNILIWKKSNKDITLQRLARLAEILTVIEDWTKENLEIKIKEIIAAEDLGVGETLWPMRVALSGYENSPGPFEIAEALGKDLTISRIKKAIEKLKELS